MAKHVNGSASGQGSSTIANTHYLKLRKAERKRRNQRQALARQRQGITRLDARILAESEKLEQNDRLDRAMTSGQRICIDCQFQTLMTEKEVSKLAGQLARVWAVQKRSKCPANLYLVNFLPNSLLSTECLRKNDGFSNYKWHICTDSLKSVFPNEPLCYLTPDSPNILQNLNADTVYVIGGLVDESRKKNASKDFADEQHINTARLPFDLYTKKVSSMPSTMSTFNQILTVNQVFELLLKVLETSDWTVAFDAVLPKRSGFMSVKS